jgi:hypothetical protein
MGLQFLLPLSYATVLKAKALIDILGIGKCVYAMIVRLELVTTANLLDWL